MKSLSLVSDVIFLEVRRKIRFGRCLWSQSDCSILFQVRAWTVSGGFFWRERTALWRSQQSGLTPPPGTTLMAANPERRRQPEQLS